MADHAVIEAQLSRLPDAQAELLRVRLGLADGQQRTPAQAAEFLRMDLADYREAETAAFLALRGGSSI